MAKSVSEVSSGQSCSSGQRPSFAQKATGSPTEDGSQEDKDYQRIGTQAIDIIYNRALVTAGRHNTVVFSRLQLNAIDALLKLDARSHKLDAKDQRALGFRSVGTMAQLLALQFLDTVTTDRWHTRAWVTQEATNAGSSLFLVLRREAGVIGRDAFRHEFNPPHSLDANRRRELPSEVVGISIREYNRLLEVLTLLAPTVLDQAENKMCRQLRIGMQLHLLQTAGALFSDLTSNAKSNPFSRLISPKPGQFGREQSMDAATALTLLASRECRDTCDRLTIVANMCRYETRLDTPEIAMRYRSLKTALPSLALLNQDLSLLVPGMYTNSKAVGSLYSPFDTHPETINNPKPRLVRRAIPPSPMPVVFGDLGEQGLRLPAYIWMVDKELDLSILRDQYSDIWQRLKISACICTRLEGESDEAMHERRDLAYAQVDKIFPDEELKCRLQDELIRHGCDLPRDSPGWGGINPDGITFELRPDADSIEKPPSKQEALAGIIFRILHYLFKLEDPLAAGLANSIWQSLRVAAVSPQRLDLPDTVCKELFTHPDVLKNPFSALQLDRDRATNGYHQTWFVERIMTKGTLWVGSYHPATFASGSRSRKGKSKADPEFVKTADQLPPGWESLDGMPILKRQVGTQLYSDILSGPRLSDPDEPNDVASFALMLSSMKWRHATLQEVEEERAQRLVSAFDVDGPCVVATPFNPAWEMLPHPAIRSMSACWVWVVEEVAEEPSGKDSRGPGQFTDHKVDDKGKRREGDGDGDKEKLDDDSDSVEPDNTRERRYKVVDKVKGLWEPIPSTPFYRYRFV